MSIAKAYNELVAVIHWIDGNVNEVNLSGDDKGLIAAGCFDMVLEHQASVALNVERKLYGSALAMLRLAAEAFFRGMWFARCATDEDAARFRATDFGKRLNDMVADIQASLGGKTDTLSNMVIKQWGTLSGFTHTGFQQVARRYTGNALKSNYPELEVVQACHFAGALGLLAAIELMVLSNNETMANAILERAKTYANKDEQATHP
jgi:hypothetical protein